MSATEELTNRIIGSTDFAETGALLALIHDKEDRARDEMAPLEAWELDELATAADNLAALARELRNDRP